MDRTKRTWGQPLRRVLTAAMLLTLPVAMGAAYTPRVLSAPHPATTGCQLNSAHGAIQHVIYIQFDNTHFSRDNPNVPSDLEQMPHLLNFMESNGVLLSHNHTPLIAHTATDILTSLTGVYPDHHGVPVSNSFRYFNPDGTSNPGVSFAYWTDPIYDYSTMTPTDTMYNMLAANGKNAPAPWAPFTRAGCNVGGVATANIELENIATDIPTVFGANSPQAQEVISNANQATADFVGIAVHCAQGAALCSSANTGLPDLLPQEPGGYNGFNALYGNKYVAPQISPTGPITDLNGNVIKDSNGDIGFPGFDGMTATVSLAYVAAMQEHGVPVTYAYISDSHDNHATGNAYGPGEAGYVAQLKANDNAFATFFTRLANDGINQSNTLFVFTSDEGDHFVGAAPSPRTCDGVTTPCTYSKIGEINGNLTGLLATEQGITTTFKVHADSAPVFYVNGNPGPTDPATRALERGVGQLTGVNPINGNTDNLTNYLADPTELKLLHMITADPHRTPTFIMFAKPDYYLATGSPDCSSPCTSEQPGFAWNHGTVSPDINTTWLGIVGPGVLAAGHLTHIWADHTDIRPTMMALLGLRDDYQHDGRVLFEVFHSWAIPAAMTTNSAVLEQLAVAYKQLNAPLGVFGMASLQAATAALKSTSSGDATYSSIESQLAAMGSQRDTVAGQMIAMLEDAAFENEPINADKAQSLIQQGYAVIGQASVLASNPE